LPKQIRPAPERATIRVGIEYTLQGANVARLEVTVPEGTQNILGIATIDAPVDRVFQAFTYRELFARWWCRGNPMRVLHFDCRDGGGWHVVGRSEDGHDGGSPTLPEDCCL
jgi:Activator of Hsp90 ATPase homolog 1-like protein